MSDNESTVQSTASADALPKQQHPIGRQKAVKDRLLLSVAAYDNVQFTEQCSQSELNGAKLAAAILVGNCTFNAVTWTAGVNYLVGGHFHPTIAVAAGATAVLLGACDHYVFFRSKQFPNGLRALRDAGLSMNVPSAFATSSSLARIARVGLSVAAGAATALVTGIMFEASAIDAELQTEYLVANHAIVERAEADFGATLAREQAAYDSELNVAKGINAAHELDVRRALRAASRSSRAAAPLQRADVQNSERLVTAENIKLDGMKQRLDRLTAARAESINRTIEASPERVPKSTSLISQVRALLKILAADPWAAVPVILVDLIVLGLDLIPMTIKAIHMPSTYEELLARHHLTSMCQQGRLTAAQLKSTQVPPLKNPPGADGLNGARPLKRRRGRPRKPKPPGLPVQTGSRHV